MEQVLHLYDLDAMMKNQFPVRMIPFSGETVKRWFASRVVNKLEEIHLVMQDFSWFVKSL